MSFFNSKSSFLDKLKEARYHNILKRDIIEFLSKINNESLYYNKDLVITQADLLIIF